MKFDKNLEKYATKRQWEILMAWESCGNRRDAAKKLGLKSNSGFSDVKAAVFKKATMHGYSPDHDMAHAVPEPFHVKGVSTYYNKNGIASGQWVKSQIDQDKRKEMMDAAVKVLCEEITPIQPVNAPLTTQCDLLNKYVITDAHVGMLAWHKEGGSNWNLDIAESVIVGAVKHALDSSPDAHTGYILQLGDFLHFDGLESVTPTSGHNLDSDGRFGKVVEYAIRILRRVVDMALEKHNHVHVVMAEGNHDLASSVWLRKMFKTLYENEPRVTVDDSELPYYTYQWGNVMLAAHHGHLKKFETLSGVFAAQFSKVWGNTTHRYGDVGHWHHRRVKEDLGLVMEQHRTLAAKDAYASRGGYFAGRELAAITYHKKLGEVSRVSVTPEMFMPKGYDE